MCPETAEKQTAAAQLLAPSRTRMYVARPEAQVTHPTGWPPESAGL